MEEDKENNLEYLLSMVMDELAEVFVFTPLYIPRSSIGYTEENATLYFSIRKNKSSMRQDFKVMEETFEYDTRKIKKSIGNAFNINVEKYIG